MTQVNNFAQKSGFGIRLLLFLFIFMVMFIATTTVIFVISHVFAHTGERNVLIMNLTAQGILLFVFTPLITARILSASATEYLHLRVYPSVKEIFWCSICLIVATPAMNFLIAWNESIKLPAIFSGIEEWMRNNESIAKNVTDVLLDTKSITEVIGIILLVGVLTGIGEELTFRGVLQHLIAEKSRNKHIAVWITAFLFSAIHLQFFGFFPRMLLGAFFGYLFVWSNSIWLPIFAHFLNNSMAAIATFMINQKQIGKEIETIGTTQNDTTWIAGISLALFLLAAIRLYTCRKKTAIQRQNTITNNKI